MESFEIRTKFLEFFEKRRHVIVPSSSLIPDDPSVLLTTAGMQQFKKYFTGELDPLKDFKDENGTATRNTASIQKSFRTSDIDEVGDESHLTFFEMLGNFSFGGYFKEEAIKYAFDFITSKEWMGLEIDYVSVFRGDKEVPADEESKKIWNSLGIKNVKEFGREDNFWGPTGGEGPCGPTTEIYIKTSAGKSVEIWNIVFNEYYCNADKSLRKLDVPGVDTGMGLERLAMVSQNVPTIFETDLFEFINSIKRKQPNKYSEQSWKMIGDHARAITFLIADGVLPSNKGRGYVLRNLIRRTITRIKGFEQLGTRSAGGQYPEYGNLNLETFSSNVIEQYKEVKDYSYLESYRALVRNTIIEEELKLRKVVESIARLKSYKNLLSASRDYFGQREIGDKLEKSVAEILFDIYQTEGGRPEFVREMLEVSLANEGIKIFDSEWAKIMQLFKVRVESHQEISRAGAEAKFGGHGLYLKTGEVTIRDKSEVEKVTRLHTATHLLHKALRSVLGPEVKQAGSDVTVDRTRFDFSFGRKLTPEELKSVEDLVNGKIKEDLPVSFVELSKKEAEETGALYFFRERYPDRVKVYFVGPALESAWSKEFCGGPHVKHTGEIGKFRITKEEAVGSGVRRIRGVVEF